MGLVTLVITPLLLAVLLSYILAPPVRYLQNKQRLSRSSAIITIYVFVGALLLLACLNIFPALLQELEELSNLLPEYTERSMFFLESLEKRWQRFEISQGMRGTIDENIQTLQSMMAQRLEKLAVFMLSVIGELIALLLVPLFTFYFLRDSETFKKKLLRLTPLSFREGMEQTLADVNKALGGYLRGLIIVSLAVGGMLYLGLLILDVEFALFLGILNALLNIIPYFGPLIGAVPVTIIAYLQSPSLAWKAIVLVIIVQQVESQLITPRVFGRELGFHPLVVVLALLLGGVFLGFFGLIFVIPLAAVLFIFIKHFYPLVKQAISEKESER